ncbi:MAG: SHOCT domain-containing protein [Bacteroidales bacterium]|nr:SHOCT domain-containing protein [Bacteroidales bacterium]
MSGWGMGFGWFGGLILMGLFIWLIVSISGHNTNHQDFQKESPMDILKRRYARGEINKEEFDRMTADLR